MIFETKRLMVKIATNSPRDIEHYYKLWNHPKVMEHVGFPNGLQISKERLNEILSKPVDSEFNTRLIVILKETGKPIGESKLGRPNEEGISDFDVKFLPEYWGKGFGTELMEKIIEYLFTKTDCKEIEATPNVENVSAQKMYERLGFFIFDIGLNEWDHKHVHYYIRRLKRSDYKG